MNPQSCRVASFKVPTPLEAAHDFLWRIHSETPAHGNVAIFNRSHYEDVLVVRVHNLVPEKEWRSRYDKINAFEKLLSDANTVIVKYMLHISKDEQKKRLIEREQDPAKAWKLSTADWKERELWDAYQQAYEDAINHCSTKYAPWYVVPADHKWYRNLLLAQTLVDVLRPFRKDWERKLKAIGTEELKQLTAMRQTHA
jgi:PPK2 family polyphosphate:nucleotide phosphotransferase